MTPLKKETFVCVDLELTGLSVEHDRIIEVAIAKFTCDEIKDTYESLVDPEMNIPDESIKIHHITNEMVAGKPKIQALLPEVCKRLTGQVVVGHGVGFDLSVLEKAALDHGINWKFPREKVIDTLRLARLYGESPNNSLEMLRQHFNIPDEGAHRAMSDVTVNIKVFKHLISQFKSLKEIMNRLKRPIVLKTMPLGKHKGRLFSEIPLDYLRWAVRQDFDQDLSFSLQSEIKRRKHKIGFQNACNPFEHL